MSAPRDADPSSAAKINAAHDARARALLFALQCFEEKNGAALRSNPDNARKDSDEESRAPQTLPQPR